MILKNFPMVSQLSQITSDGRISEDAQFECVPASIGAGLLWYLGKKQWDTSINPDLMKDQAYGEAYKNAGTAASAYVPFCAKLGFKLYPFDGNPGALVSETHKQLQAGCPVIFTQPDSYVSVSLGWTHVSVFYGESTFSSTQNGLICLDPYIAKAIERTDAEWARLLLGNQVWILERIADVTIDLSMPEVAKHFELANSTGKQWRCRDTGKILQGAILDWYRKFGNAGLCGLTYLGLNISNEIPLPGSKHNAVKVHFENGVVFYDPMHEFDTRPGAPNDSVYLAHAYAGPGVPQFVTDMAKQVSDLTATVASLQKQLSNAPDNVALQAQLDAALGRLDKIKADLV